MAEAPTDARHALALVGADPAAALVEADRIIVLIARPRTDDDAAEVATAHRAAGLAQRELGDPVEAERRLRRAVGAAERFGLAEIAAEARMSLAYVLLERGKAQAALSSVDHASGVLSGVPAARLRAVRALVLQRSGRTREALDEYASSLMVLQREGDREWQARLRNNRGLLYAYAGDTDAAVTDLRAARVIYLEHGLRSLAADSLCNLGWVVGMQGDVPESLELFDLADVECADLEQPERWVDRAEVLLRAGLSAEAADTARTAVTWLSGRGWDALEAEARLLHARCLLRLGAPEQAHEEATLARAFFVRQDKLAWAALADYVVMTSSLVGPGRVRPADLDRAMRVASVLRDAGWDAPAADLRITAGRAALGCGDQPRARSLLGPLASRGRVSRLDVRSRIWFARALVQELDGDSRAADAALRKAWRAVEQQRTLLGATELRAGAATHAVALVEVGTRLAVRTSSAVAAFDWAELGRAAVLRYRPALPPKDPELADVLVRLRLAVRADEEARLAGRHDRRAAALRSRHEAQVVRLTRHASGGVAALRPVRAADVRARLQGDAMVHFLRVDDQLWAVVVTERRTSLRHVGSAEPVASTLATLTFGLRRALTGFGSSAGLAAAADAAQRAAARLDSLLLGPLQADIGDRPLVICPTGRLVGVPWSVLPSCRGRTVRVAPSASVWCAGRDAGPSPRPHVVAVAGPRLPGAAAEVTEVARLHPGSTRLIGEEATVARVLAAASGASVLHLAAHGHLREDNPLFSALDLADGQLTGYDLESIGSAPGAVILPACSSGAGRALVADETLGLAWTLIGLGAASVVAPLLPVPDEATRELMIALHRRLSTGWQLADALADAQRSTSEHDRFAAVVSAAFVAYGA